MRRNGIGLVIAAALLVACGGGGDEPDGGATLACRTFRGVAADFDTFTIDELRDRLRDVDDDAKLSDERGVASAARAMLLAVTPVNDEELATAVRRMDAACTQVGA